MHACYFDQVQLGKIAIIDSGIDVKHRRLSGCKVSGVSIRLREGSCDFTVDDSFEDSLGHGTACAGVIRRTVPDVELVAVKVFHHELVASEKALCGAIEWCISQQLELVNLSLGLEEHPSPTLVDLCHEAAREGTILVAAANNDRRIDSFPACLPSVFGVTWGSPGKRTDFGYLPGSNVEFVAKGTMQRVAWIGGGFTIMGGSSLACAHFCAIVARIAAERSDVRGFDELKECLISQACSTVLPMQHGRSARSFAPSIVRRDLAEIGANLFNLERKLPCMEKLAVFPIGEKEMRAFEDLPECACREVVCYFGYPRRLSRDGSSHMKGRIEDFADNSEQFDTVVIGYFLDQVFEANVKFGLQLLARAMHSHKNIFMYDRKVLDYLDSQRDQIDYHGETYLPEITKASFEQVGQFRFLPRSRVPTVAVVGTSNRQGKFTTQLRLKCILEQEGYQVSHISTEPQGELLGADFCFAYGYEGTVSLERGNWGMFLNALIKGIQEFKRPQIIITGTQGMTVPRAFTGEPFGNECSGLDFLVGVQPDAILCAINPEDSLEIIRDTCAAVEMFSRAKPIAYTMSPWRRDYRTTKSGRVIASHRLLDEQEMKERMEYFCERLEQPVFDIMDRSNDQPLVRIVEQFF